MSTQSNWIRPAFIHVGMHKTGTTSLQGMLAANELRFRAAGVHVPRTGRLDECSAGLHNVAWELASDPRFDPARGAFDELLDEIERENAPAVCLSSEDFEFCHRDPAALIRLRNGLTAIGYDPRIVCYLRPHADYIESLYAEISPVWNVDFSRFLETILTEGVYGCSPFDYAKLTTAFEEIFGRARMIVRAYRGAAPAATLLQEFTTLVAPAATFADVRVPGRLNVVRDFAHVIAGRESLLGRSLRFERIPGRFDPLTLADLARVALRFAEGYARIGQRFGVRIAPATPGRIAVEVLAGLLPNRAARRRKELIRIPLGAAVAAA